MKNELSDAELNEVTGAGVNFSAEGIQVSFDFLISCDGIGSALTDGAASIDGLSANSWLSSENFQTLFASLGSIVDATGGIVSATSNAMSLFA